MTKKINIHSLKIRSISYSPFLEEEEEESFHILSFNGSSQQPKIIYKNCFSLKRVFYFFLILNNCFLLMIKEDVALNRKEI